MSLTGVGKETVEISNRGWYVASSGARVSIEDAVARAAEGTRLYRPGDYEPLGPPETDGVPVTVQVTSETTGKAAGVSSSCRCPSRCPSSGPRPRTPARRISEGKARTSATRWSGEPSMFCASPLTTGTARSFWEPGAAECSGTTLAQVADVFVQLLATVPLAHASARVVFAVYDRSKSRAALRAFEERCPCWLLTRSTRQRARTVLQVDRA